MRKKQVGPQLAIRLSKEENTLIRAYASTMHVTRSAVIHELIEKGAPDMRTAVLEAVAEEKGTLGEPKG